MKTPLLLGSALLAAFLLLSSVYTLSETEHAILTHNDTVSERDGSAVIKQFFQTVYEMQNVHTILQRNMFISVAIFEP